MPQKKEGLVGPQMRSFKDAYRPPRENEKQYDEAENTLFKYSPTSRMVNPTVVTESPFISRMLGLVDKITGSLRSKETGAIRSPSFAASIPGGTPSWINLNPENYDQIEQPLLLAHEKGHILQSMLGHKVENNPEADSMVKEVWDNFQNLNQNTDSSFPRMPRDYDAEFQVKLPDDVLEKHGATSYRQDINRILRSKSRLGLAGIPTRK